MTTSACSSSRCERASPQSRYRRAEPAPDITPPTIESTTGASRATVSQGRKVPTDMAATAVAMSGFERYIVCFLNAMPMANAARHIVTDDGSHEASILIEAPLSKGNSEWVSNEQ